MEDSIEINPDNKENIIVSRHENLPPSRDPKLKTTTANPCPECGKVYRHRCHLLQHMRSHTKETQAAYYCGICNMSSHRRDVISRHVKRCHTDAPSFACDQCGGEFFEKFDLQRHMLSVHSDEKPFRCEQCGKAFAQKSSLTAHGRVHLPPALRAKKPPPDRRGHFPCPECDEAFTRLHSMTRHLRTHSERPEIAKPYQCDRCRKRFTRRFHFGLHKKICRE